MRFLLILSFILFCFIEIGLSRSFQKEENINQIQFLKNGKIKSQLKPNRKIIFTAGFDANYKNRKGKLIAIISDSLFINTGNKQNIKIQSFHINEISMIGYPTTLTKVITGVVAFISPSGVIYPFYRKFKTEKGWEIRTSKKLE